MACRAGLHSTVRLACSAVRAAWRARPACHAPIRRIASEGAFDSGGPVVFVAAATDDAVKGLRDPSAPRRRIPTPTASGPPVRSGPRAAHPSRPPPGDESCASRATPAMRTIIHRHRIAAWPPSASTRGAYRGLRAPTTQRGFVAAVCLCSRAVDTGEVGSTRYEACETRSASHERCDASRGVGGNRRSTRRRVRRGCGGAARPHPLRGRDSSTAVTVKSSEPGTPRRTDGLTVRVGRENAPPTAFVGEGLESVLTSCTDKSRHDPDSPCVGCPASDHRSGLRPDLGHGAGCQHPRWATRAAKRHVGHLRQALRHRDPHQRPRPAVLRSRAVALEVLRVCQRRPVQGHPHPPRPTQPRTGLPSAKHRHRLRRVNAQVSTGAPALCELTNCQTAGTA